MTKPSRIAALTLLTFLLATARAVANPEALDLGRLLDRVRATHPEVALARISQLRAQLERQVATEGRWTGRVGLDGFGVANQRLPLSGTAPDPSGFSQGTLSAEGRLVLLDGGRLGYADAAAAAGEQAAGARAGTALRDLADGVIRGFWDLRRAELLRQVAQQQVQQARATWEAGQADLAHGRRAAGDVAGLEAAHLAAESAWHRQDQTVAEFRARLAALVGLSDDAWTLAATPVAPDSLPEASGSWQARPEWLAQRAAVEQAQARLGEAAAALAPTVGLSGRLETGNGLVRPDIQLRTTDPLASQWSLRLDVAWPWLDNGRAGRAAERARLDLLEADQRAERLRRDLERDERLARERLRQALLRLKLQDRAVVVVGQAHALTATRFRQGLALPVELESARTRLAQAQADRIDTGIEGMVAHWDLALALGKENP